MYPFHGHRRSYHRGHTELPCGVQLMILFLLVVFAIIVVALR